MEDVGTQKELDLENPTTYLPFEVPEEIKEYTVYEATVHFLKDKWPSFEWHYVETDIFRHSQPIQTNTPCHLCDGDLILEFSLSEDIFGLKLIYVDQYDSYTTMAQLQKERRLHDQQDENEIREEVLFEGLEEIVRKAMDTLENEVQNRLTLLDYFVYDLKYPRTDGHE